MNRLAASSSPYLRQHARNPVHWWPWIPEAFEEAKRRNLPIHLSIGYAACHWCHVMAHESFSDLETAKLLNDNFVSIKVDREERPEIDQIYMRSLHALGEQGGWPLTMFLTPDADPFWGGTYFPPEPRWGRPSFRQILGAVSAAWTAQDEAVTRNAAALREHLNRPVIAATGGRPDARLLDQAAGTILSIWDRERGSFQGAPKFPNPLVLDVLWRAFRRNGDNEAHAAVLRTLTYLCQGGIYDHVGGGFARYSVDAQWLVPHFEKMLYDNGQLLSLLSYAYHETMRPLFRIRIDETVGWLLREMRHPGGGFASSQDADTEHEEGLTYVWSVPELQQVLGSDFDMFSNTYGVTDQGNWEGHNILNRLSPTAREWLGEAEEEALRAMREKLLRRRNHRAQPSRDDKVLADWNGLATTGLAHAAHATGSGDARQAGLRAFRFVSESMADGDRLAHSWLDGSLVYPGVATDYANMIRAALALFSLDGDPAFLERAEAWFTTAKRHHYVDSAAAYNLVADDAAPLIAQPLSIADEATPAATGVMAQNAATLFMVTGDASYRDHAERIAGHLTTRTGQDTIGAASLQSAFDTLIRGRLAFVLGEGPTAESLINTALRRGRSGTSCRPRDRRLSIRSGHPAEGKRPSGAAAMFLCDAFRCLPEMASVSDAADALAATRHGIA